MLPLHLRLSEDTCLIVIRGHSTLRSQKVEYRQQLNQQHRGMWDSSTRYLSLQSFSDEGLRDVLLCLFKVENCCQLTLTRRVSVGPILFFILRFEIFQFLRNENEQLFERFSSGGGCNGRSHFQLELTRCLITSHHVTASLHRLTSRHEQRAHFTPSFLPSVGPCVAQNPFQNSFVCP